MLLTLNRKTDYALVALAGLATDLTTPVSARALSHRLRLPLPVLRNILKQLTRYGLLRSSQGTSGGYRLTRRPEEVALTEVIEAIEGPLRLTRCCDVDGADTCDLADVCAIRGPVQRTHRLVAAVLEKVTLADLIDESPQDITLPNTGVAPEGLP